MLKPPFVRVVDLSAKRRAEDNLRRLEQCAALHIDPAFAGVGVLAPVVGLAEFPRSAQPCGNLPIVAESATALAVLAPAIRAVEHGLFHQPPVGQVPRFDIAALGSLAQFLDKFLCVLFLHCYQSLYHNRQ